MSVKLMPGYLYYIKTDDNNYLLPFMHIGSQGENHLLYFFGYGFYNAQTLKGYRKICSSKIKSVLMSYYRSLVLRAGDIEKAIAKGNPNCRVSIDDMLYYSNIPIELLDFNINTLDYYANLYKSTKANSNIWTFNTAVFNTIKTEKSLQLMTKSQVSKQPTNTNTSEADDQATGPTKVQLDSSDEVEQQVDFDEEQANYENNRYKYISEPTNFLPTLDKHLMFKQLLLDQKQNPKKVKKSLSYKGQNVHNDIPNETKMLQNVYFLVYRNSDEITKALQPYWLNVCRYGIQKEYLDYTKQKSTYVGLLVGNVNIDQGKFIQTIIGSCTMYETDKLVSALTTNESPTCSGCPSDKTNIICTRVKRARNANSTSCPAVINNYLITPKAPLVKDTDITYLYIDTVCSYFEGFGGAIIKCIENSFVPFLNSIRSNESQHIKGLMLRALKSVYFLYPRLGFLRQNFQGVFPLCYVNLEATSPLDRLDKENKTAQPGFLTLDTTKTPVYSFNEFKAYYQKWNPGKKPDIKHFNIHNRPLVVFEDDSLNNGYLFIKYLAIDYNNVESSLQPPSKIAKANTAKTTNIASRLSQLSKASQIYILFNIGKGTAKWYLGDVKTIEPMKYNNNKGIESYYRKADVYFPADKENWSLKLYETSNYEYLTNKPNQLQNHLNKSEIIWSLDQPLNFDQIVTILP